MLLAVSRVECIVISSNFAVQAQHHRNPSVSIQNAIMLSLSRIHFGKTHYEVRKLGEGAFGESYLAINMTDADQIRARLYKTDRSRMYDELRRQLVAVKFSLEKDNPENDGVGIENEIGVLTEAIPPEDHPRIIKLHQCFDDGDIAWLTTKYMTGGDSVSYTH